MGGSLSAAKKSRLRHRLQPIQKPLTYVYLSKISEFYNQHLATWGVPTNRHALRKQVAGYISLSAYRGVLPFFNFVQAQHKTSFSLKGSIATTGARSNILLGLTGLARGEKRLAARRRSNRTGFLHVQKMECSYLFTRYIRRSRFHPPPSRHFVIYILSFSTFSAHLVYKQQYCYPLLHIQPLHFPPHIQSISSLIDSQPGRSGLPCSPLHFHL